MKTTIIFSCVAILLCGLWSCHGDEDESTHFSRKILSNDHSVHNNYSPVIFTMKDKLRNNFKTLKMFFPMVDFLSSKSFQTVNKNLETNSLKRFPRNTNLENDLNNNTIEIISSSPITLNNNITSEITTTGSNLTFPNSTVTSIFATINTTVTSISTTINTTFPTISSLSTNSSKESNSNVTVLSGNMQTNKTFSSDIVVAPDSSVWKTTFLLFGIVTAIVFILGYLVFKKKTLTGGVRAFYQVRQTGTNSV